MHKNTATLNDYLIAWKMFGHRLKWDLKAESWRSRRKLASWKDRFPGKKAVIACNGPSLLKSDLGLLEGTFTFGLNKINLLFEDSSFRPSCIVSVNPLVIEQNARFYSSTDIPLFLDSVGTRYVAGSHSIAFLHSIDVLGFASDCSVSVFQGYTVTFVALQLAFHMGFNEVALIGCDHNFTFTGTPNATLVSGDSDENHFDPRYFSGGQEWHAPDLLGSELSYKRAKDVYEVNGRRIVNATVGGRLEIFERLSLAEFLSSV